MESDKGQAADAPLDGTSEPAPETTGSTAGGTDAQTTGGDNPTGTDTGTDATANDTTNTEMFFDPSEVTDPALLATHKSMQSAFSKKMAQVSEGRKKIEAYDQFMANPVEAARQVLQQYGHRVDLGQQPAGDGQQQSQAIDPNWEPQSWQEVVDVIGQRMLAQQQNQLSSQIAPLQQNLQQQKQEAFIKTLDEQAPDWRTYEDEMTAALRQNPNMVNNPVGLYRMVVPLSVIESRAAQKAVKKLQTKAASSAGNVTPKTSQTSTDKPPQFKTIREAAAYAAAQLKAAG